MSFFGYYYIDVDVTAEFWIHDCLCVLKVQGYRNIIFVFRPEPEIKPISPQGCWWIGLTIGYPRLFGFEFGSYNINNNVIHGIAHHKKICCYSYS